MRLHVLCDRDGRILAASRADAEPQYGGIVPIPVPSRPNQTVSELEVPAESERGELDEICRRLRVDLEHKRLIALNP
jgi:hypothetical protein